MADITLSCAKCGASATFSEFVAEEGRRCPACGTPFAAETAVRTSPLRVEPMDPASRRGLDGRVIETRTPTAVAPMVAGARQSAAENVGTERRPSMLAGWLIVLCLVPLLLWTIVRAQGDGSWREVYLAARWAVLGVAVILVLVEALRDSAFRGLLCLLVPFYLVWYALTRIESYWRQALVLVALVMLVAEYAWLREQSLFVLAGDRVNGFIDAVGRQIERAGEAGGL